jgi:hypothetical protein
VGYETPVPLHQLQCQRADSIAAQKVEKEFGVSALFSSHMLGPFMLWMARREERRLAAGKTYEPPTFVERTNWAST